MKEMLLHLIKRWRLLVMLLLIGGLAVLFKGYNLENTYQFNWDQERDAWVIKKILVDKKPVLIGPRVVGEDGFFLGPFWYYFLVPFYWTFNLDPIAGAWATLIVGVVTSLLIGYLVYRWFGIGPGLLIGGWSAMQLDRIAWNPMLVPMLTLINVLIMRKLNIQSRKLWLIWGFLVGLGMQVHFQMVVWMVIWMIYSLDGWIKNKALWIWIGLGWGVFGLTWLPLLVFDIRHDFLNLKILGRFAFSRVSGDGVNLFVGWEKLINAIDNQWWMAVVILIVGVVGLIFWGKSRLEKTALVLLVVVLPVAFGFYSREVSEYYFMISVLMLNLGWAYWLGEIYKMNKNVFLFCAVLFLFGFGYLQKNKLSQLDNGMGLSYKKKIVQILQDQNRDDKIFVSYSVDVNYDSGFRYLIDWFGVTLVDDAHLWTVLMPPDRVGEKGELIGQAGNYGVVRR